jgi:tRNA-dependent cyclodipeptide synthase
MSAGNSYFKQEIVLELLKFASTHFHDIVIMAPNEPAEHTFLSLGYDKKSAKKKARLNANLLQNRAKRAVDILIKEKSKTSFHVIEWTDEIIPNKYYQEMLIKIKKLYKENEQFREDARETTRKVIESKLKEGLNTEKAINEAVNYLLKELSFILASPTIYNASHVTYMYHHNWPIYQKLIAGEYDNKPRTNLSFLLSRLEN